MRRQLIAAAAAATALALTACGSSSGGGSTASSAPAPSSAAGATSAGASTSASTITIKDFAFSGALTVKAGAKVTVVNEDSVPHTVTDTKTKKFDTGKVDGSGAKGTFTAPSTPGKYAFICTFHPEMKGTLTVTS